MYTTNVQEQVVTEVAILLRRLAYHRRPDLKAVELGQWVTNASGKTMRWQVLLLVPNAIFTLAWKAHKALSLSSPVTPSR
jgi:hypothetical protein